MVAVAIPMQIIKYTVYYCLAKDTFTYNFKTFLSVLLVGIVRGPFNYLIV
jgi:hypothetical protein